jgi:hypothetical protein
MLQEQANDTVVNKFKEFTKAQDTYRDMYLYDYHTQLADFIYGK